MQQYQQGTDHSKMSFCPNSPASPVSASCSPVRLSSANACASKLLYALLSPSRSASSRAVVARASLAWARAESISATASLSCPAKCEN